eukprot:TRINITY_DN22530_c0_g1_i1.p1 TRINITY_DN22530_c0_g1~~TRINITY_DN22530_c0_g1_i1.p1  ORF type:complete len:299 (-),score=44.98 TRINITY_DN22530_c0_g1_i1:133-1029(-)
MNFKFSFKFIRSVVGSRTTGMIGARPPSRLPHEMPLSSALHFNARFTASFHCLSSKERSPQVTANVYAEAKRKGRKTSNSKAALNGKQTREEVDQQWLLSLSPMVESPTVTSPQEILQRNERMWILGIDPDVGGAIALLKPSSDGSPSDAHVYDAPSTKFLVGKRIRRRLDTRLITSLLKNLEAPVGSVAYIEEARPLPCDGRLGWWSSGFNYGLWIGILVASGFSVVPVSSPVWKKHYGLSGEGSTKDASRVLARSLFASLSPQLQRKKDHGRAEALLIAAYGRSIISGNGRQICRI